MHDKATLAEFICALNQTSSFFCGGTFWSTPVFGFSHNNSLPRKFMKERNCLGTHKRIARQNVENILGENPIT